GIYKIDVIDMNGPLDEKLRQRIEEQGIEIYRRS
ncbi:MAG TPA: nucleotidyltransferase domain-containing protein, partial [Peptococcaceae bacterium]|nr:nucleotidyltransferase domain-containing protein [Peptococcaceae bacterium]